MRRANFSRSSTTNGFPLHLKRGHASESPRILQKYTEPYYTPPRDVENDLVGSPPCRPLRAYSKVPIDKRRRRLIVHTDINNDSRRELNFRMAVVDHPTIFAWSNEQTKVFRKPFPFHRGEKLQESCFHVRCGRLCCSNLAFCTHFVVLGFCWFLSRDFLLNAFSWRGKNPCSASLELCRLKGGSTREGCPSRLEKR